MQFGVPGLPGRVDRLQPGDLYAVDLEVVSPRHALAVQLLRANPSAAPAFFVSNLPAEAVIARFASTGASDLLQRIKNGSLVLLTTKSVASQQFFRHGIDALTAELEELGVRQDSLLVVDKADDMFSVHDPVLAALQASSYRSWLRKKGVTAVMLFLLRPQVVYLASYRAMTDYFSGSARIHAHGRELFLTTDHWLGAAGLTAGESFKLTADTVGLMRAAAPGSDASFVENGECGPVALPWLPDRPQAAHGALDPDLVLHNCVDLADGVGDTALAHWEYLGSFFALAERAQQVRAGTVLLSYSTELTLRELAEQVFLLRRMLVPGVRIVVKEAGRALRYSGTALLLKLGANFVLGEGMSRSRLVMTLRSLRGHTWQMTELKFEVAVASAEPVGAAGAVPLGAFHDGVETSLLHAETLGVPCQLMVVPGVDRQEISSLLGALRLARSTDLVSATEEALLLFLFGCDTEERTAVLKRVLDRPEAEPECYGYCAATDIRAALKTQFPVSDALLESRPTLTIREGEPGAGRRPALTGDPAQEGFAGAVKEPAPISGCAAYGKRAHGS